ncbi:Werner Syndrome-like exonuclease [Bienertia sinuspersici]
MPDEAPKALKDLLSNSRTIVVGLGINAMVKKLESETDLLIPKQVELRDLVQEKMGQGGTAKSNLGSLAKLVIGPEMEVVKPKSMTWWGPGSKEYLSDELAQYGSTVAFLVAHMASKLLTVEP